MGLAWYRTTSTKKKHTPPTGQWLLFRLLPHSELGLGFHLVPGDLGDVDVGIRLAVTLRQAVVLLGLVLEDADLLAKRVPDHLRLHQLAVQVGLPDLHVLPVVHQEDLLEGELVPNLQRELLDGEDLPRLHAVLVPTNRHHSRSDRLLHGGCRHSNFCLSIVVHNNLEGVHGHLLCSTTASEEETSNCRNRDHQRGSPTRVGSAFSRVLNHERLRNFSEVSALLRVRSRCPNGCLSGKLGHWSALNSCGRDSLHGGGCGGGCIQGGGIAGCAEHQPANCTH
mmetsp:Transcript_15986/g.27963  ORF Transcript_15986/g.27963 Transcript_15986/m.27963 type:complete len:281 (-) Transcript_15986:144-986(-)